MRNNFIVFWKTFGAYRRHLIALTLLGSFGALLEGVGINITIPLLSSLTGGTGGPTDVITHAVKGLFDFLHIPFSFRYLLAFIIILFFARAVALAGFTFLRGWISADFLAKESREMFKRLLGASWPYLLRQKMGYVHNTLARDMQRTASLFEMGSQFIQSLTGFTMYFIVAFTISPLMTALSFVGAAVLLGVTRPLLKRTVSGGENMAVNEKNIAQFLSEHVGSMKLVKASGVGKQALAYSEHLLQNLRGAYMQIMKSRAIATSLFQPFALVFVVVLFSIMYRSPEFNILSFAVTLYLVHKIFTYAESAQSSFHGIGEVVPYVRNVLIFKEELERAEEEKELGTVPFSFVRELTLAHVSLSYDSKKALDDISFTIGCGETVGLVGPSGGGKTSIADILLRLFVPDKGELLLDRVSAPTISVDEWRHRVAYVPQEVSLFHASVEENVRFYRDDISQEEVIDALTRANIYDAVKELPEGLATIVGDRGVLLSGGQRQRIALARALVGKPSLLILDEATSALDHESEKLIHDSIKALHGTITVLIIAHRPSTVAEADRIFVLDHGRIVEQGTPQELLKNQNSYFYKMQTV